MTLKKLTIPIFLALLVVLNIGAWLTYAKRNQGGSTSVQKTLYTCPMHPSISSDHPGQCPICHMDLQKVDSSPHAEAAHKKERKLLFYRNPMDASKTSPVPAKDSMGMDYVPVYSDEAEESGNSDVAGRSAFSLSQQRQQLIGVTTAKAETREMEKEIRANGKVAFDPDLYTAIEEYRQALLSRSQMEASPYPRIKDQAQALIDSARTKLRLMGISDAQVDRLGNAKTNAMNLLLPKGHVWIYAEVYEYELPAIKSGQSVEVTSGSTPGKSFRGTISSISPVLNAQTRTARVRALVPDPSHTLLPDSFVDVKIKVKIGKSIAVPVDAVLHSGDQDFVFVVKEGGTFEPKAVKAGLKTKEYQQILSGLTENEEVATSANFLLDSESRLRATIQSSSKEPK